MEEEEESATSAESSAISQRNVRMRKKHSPAILAERKVTFPKIALVFLVLKLEGQRAATLADPPIISQKTAPKRTEC